MFPCEVHAYVVTTKPNVSTQLQMISALLIMPSVLMRNTIPELSISYLWLFYLIVFKVNIS